MLYSVIIPNWCGGAKLRHCLRSIVKEARRTLARRGDWDFEVIVCDDASPDGDADTLSAEFPAAEFPEFRLLLRAQNGGFGPTVNEACEAAHGNVLCLCNNDLAVQRGYFEALLAPILAASAALDAGPFEGVTATSARTEDATGHPNHACMRGRWERGRMQLFWRDRPPPAADGSERAGAEFEPMEAHFLQAGAAAVRADAWRALGGLDNRFAPGYWEDYDFSHRLRAAGGTIHYTPAARAFHLGQASMRARFGAGRVRDLRERNRLLFDALHAPPEERTALPAAVSAEIAAEWRTGGPFHLTRGLRLAVASAPSPETLAVASPIDLYPEADTRFFLPADR